MHIVFFLHLLALMSLWKEIKYASISELFVDPLTCLSSPPKTPHSLGNNRYEVNLEIR